MHLLVGMFIYARNVLMLTVDVAVRVRVQILLLKMTPILKAFHFFYCTDLLQLMLRQKVKLLR